MPAGLFFEIFYRVFPNHGVAPQEVHVSEGSALFEPRSALRVIYRLPFGDGGGEATAVSVGARSLVLALDERLPVGEPIALDLEGADGGRLLGRVAWCHEVGEGDGAARCAGVELVFTSPEERRRVERVLLSLAGRDPTPAVGEGTTCLVLDDDVATRMVVVRALRRVENLTLLEAGTVAAALRVVRDHDVALAFLDIGLPDGDGSRVHDEIAARHPDAQIIVMTGQPSVDLAVQAFRREAFHFVQKPFADLSALPRLAKQALQVRALERDRQALVRRLAAAVEALRESRRPSRLYESSMAVGS
jgi:FixJ family two-component response regulator